MAEPKRREWLDRQLIAALRGPARRSDSELRWILVGLLLADLGAAGVVLVVGHGGLLVEIGGWVVITVVAGAVMFRGRRYSEGGLWWFLITLLVFLGWNWGLVLPAVRWSGLALAHARLGWGVIELAGALPLLVTIAILSLKLRAVGT